MWVWVWSVLLVSVLVVIDTTDVVVDHTGAAVVGATVPPAESNVERWQVRGRLPV